MTDFTNPDKIQACLGDYWYSIYYSNEQIGDYVASLCFNRSQWDTQFKDVKDSLSRHKIPVYETINVKPLKVLQSDFIESSKVFAKHDGTYKYNNVLKYDIPLDYQYAFELPDKVVDFSYVSNKLLDGGEHFEPIIAGNKAIIDKNIFDGTFNIENVYDSDGNITDKYAILWLFDVKLDNDDIFYQYGYIFNINLPSSERYKQLINVLYDSLINGPSELTLRLYLSTITGIPVALYDETVLSIKDKVITTDKNSYKVQENSTIIVNNGDFLHPGDILTDDLTIYDKGEVDDSIRAISLDRRYIGLCISSIVFENKDYDTTISTENKHTRLDLPILANPVDKKLFNDTVFTVGVENNVQVDDDTAKEVLNSI